MAASEAGHMVLKFFPAELSGGIDKLNAFKSVFPDITFIPTGGITNKNIANYLSLDNVVAVGASSAMPESLIRSKSWDEITNNLLEIKTIIETT
jgi:2-dehydro-3-deoxyphosphogluconate aldolase/(4S)-4-hydroxy-2-oxoglutarate aldolase